MLRIWLLLIPLLLTSCGTAWNMGLGMRCAGSEECAEQGKCGVRTWRAGDRGWRCVVRSSSDCADSVACREHGACALDPHMDPEACIATRPEHCLDSAACREQGRCAVGLDGGCVPSEAGCRASQACAEEQRCAPSNERACGRSWADPITWCDEPCETEGACRREGLRCLVDDEAACRASSGCSDHGRCAFDPHSRSCVAAAPADCQASSACRDGLSDGTYPCTLRGSRCADERSACERSPACLLMGDCQALEGTCAPRDGVCPETIECLTRGRCEHANHLCLPMEPAHCEASMECQAFGRCDLSTWLVQQCVQPDERSLGGYGCPGDPCLREGRCLRRDHDTCLTPTELGLEDTLPRLPAPPEPPAKAPMPPPVDGAQLQAQLNRQPVDFDHALLGDRGGEARFALLADAPISCAQLAGTEPIPKSTRWARLTLAPVITDDDVLSATSTSWLDPETSGANGAVPTGSVQLEGSKLVLALQSQLRNTALSLHGSTQTRSCGSLHPVTTARPQPALELSVAGERVPVAAALLDRMFDRPILVLASQPVTCSWRFLHGGEPDLLVLVDSEGRVKLEGARLRGGVGVWPSASPPTLGDVDGNDQLEASIDFAPARSNPTVSIRGEVRATACERP
jgi:hypothetical protein